MDTFTNPKMPDGSYQNLTPTAVGNIDLDWFNTLWYLGGSHYGMANQIGSFRAHGLYRAVKSAWERQSEKQNYGERGVPHVPERLYEDPGEGVAVGAYGKGMRYSTLFPESWMQANCPGY